MIGDHPFCIFKKRQVDSDAFARAQMAGADQVRTGLLSSPMYVVSVSALSTTPVDNDIELSTEREQRSRSLRHGSLGIATRAFLPPIRHADVVRTRVELSLNLDRGLWLRNILIADQQIKSVVVRKHVLVTVTIWKEVQDSTMEMSHADLYGVWKDYMTRY